LLSTYEKRLGPARANSGELELALDSPLFNIKKAGIPEINHAFMLNLP
jgi:hypothetical protein